MERVKKDNIILNVELTQYKLLVLNKELNDTFINDLCTDFQKLKINLECNQADDKLELELNSRGKEKMKNVSK